MMYNKKMTYQDWEELSADEQEEKLVKYRKANRLMASYYKRQRIMGYIFVVISLIAVGVGCAMNWQVLYTLGAVVCIFGLYCVITRRMIYIDKYYFECQDRLRNII